MDLGVDKEFLMRHNDTRIFHGNSAMEILITSVVELWDLEATKNRMGDISPKATRTALILSCKAETKFQFSKVMPNLDFELLGLGLKENGLFTSLGRRTRRNTTSMVSMVQTTNHDSFQHWMVY